MAEAHVDFKGRDAGLGAVTKQVERSLQRLVQVGRQQAGSVANLRNASAASKLAYQEQRQAIDLATRSARRLGIEQANQIRQAKEAERQARASERAAQRQDRAIRSQTRSIGRLGAALAAVAFDQIERGLERVTERANLFLRVNRAFDSLTFDANVDQDRFLANARRATQGIISDLDLIQAANFGLLLGLDLTEQSFAELAEAAVTLGRAVGQGPVKSLNDLLLALGRGSPRILDNLGLIVKVSEANRIMAEELGKTTAELTGQEKQLAFFNLAVEKANARVRSMGGLVLEAGDQLTRFDVAIQNIVNRFSRFTAVAAGVGQRIAGILAPLALLRLTVGQTSFEKIIAGSRRLGTRLFTLARGPILGPVGVVVAVAALVGALDNLDRAQERVIEGIRQQGNLVNADTILRDRHRQTYERLVDVHRQLAEAQAELGRGGGEGPFAGQVARANDLQRQYDNLKEQLVEIGSLLDRPDTPGEGLAGPVEDAEAAAKALEERLKRAEAAAEQAARWLFEMRNAAFEAQRDFTLDRQAQELRDYMLEAANAAADFDASLDISVDSNIAGVFAQQLAEIRRGIPEIERELESVGDALQVQDIQNAFEGLFDAIFGEAESFGERMRRVFQRLARDILSSLVFRRLANSIVGSLGGGDIPGRQSGGHTRRGLVLVGEAGPEIVDFREPGRVYTNQQLSQAIGSGGPSSFVFAPVIQSADGPAIQRALRDGFAAMKSEIRAEFLRDIRRPGSLSNLAG